MTTSRTRATRTRPLLASAVAAALALATGLPAAASRGATPPDDPKLAKQWGVDALHLPDAWERSTGEGVVIAVVDTGIDPDHPDLRDRIVDGHDFVDDDDSPRDENGHGTHVAGIAAAAGGNATGITGAAPDALIMPVRVLDGEGAGDEADIADGIVWAAEHGAGVINLSLGEVGFASRILKGGPLNRAIRRAANLGSVVVAASGNEGSVKRTYRIAVPVVVVGAVDESGEAAEFSNFGDQRAVVAPGVGILSTAPTYPTTVWPEGSGGYELLDGTSMAAPFVSGVAALLLTQGRSPESVSSVLFETAQNSSDDPRLGSGLVDASAAVGAPTAGENDDAGDDRGDGPPLLPIVGGVAALLIALAVVVAVRRRTRSTG